MSIFDSPSLLDDARNVATIVAAVIALIGVWPVFRNIRASERSLRAKVYFDTLDLLDGKNHEVRDLRKTLEAAIQTARTSDPERPFDILEADETVQRQLEKLARVYDKVGLLVKHGVIPTRFLFDFYSRPIIVAWQHLSPLVNKERGLRPQPHHMRKFETLAIGAALYREAKYGDAPPFSIDDHQRSLWAGWRPWNPPFPDTDDTA